MTLLLNCMSLVMFAFIRQDIDTHTLINRCTTLRQEYNVHIAVLSTLNKHRRLTNSLLDVSNASSTGRVDRKHTLAFYFNLYSFVTHICSDLLPLEVVFLSV
jgi:hypothetical protein